MYLLPAVMYCVLVLGGLFTLKLCDLLLQPSVFLFVIPDLLNKLLFVLCVQFINQCCNKSFVVLRRIIGGRRRRRELSFARIRAIYGRTSVQIAVSYSIFMSSRVDECSIEVLECFRPEPIWTVIFVIADELVGIQRFRDLSETICICAMASNRLEEEQAFERSVGCDGRHTIVGGPCCVAVSRLALVLIAFEEAFV